MEKTITIFKFQISNEEVKQAPKGYFIVLK